MEYSRKNTKNSSTMPPFFPTQAVRFSIFLTLVFLLLRQGKINYKDIGCVLN